MCELPESFELHVSIRTVVDLSPNYDLLQYTLRISRWSLYIKYNDSVDDPEECLYTAFDTWRVVTQGDPTSSMIFNIAVDEVLQEVMYVVCIPQEAQHGTGWSAGK